MIFAVIDCHRIFKLHVAFGHGISLLDNIERFFDHPTTVDVHFSSPPRAGSSYS